MALIDSLPADPERECAVRDASARPLRIALLINASEAPASWVLRLVRRLGEASALDLCLCIRTDAPSMCRKETMLQARWLALEAKFAARAVPVEGAGPESLLARIQTVSVNDEITIGRLDLDVILDVAGGHGTGCEANLARHGIWFTGITARNASLAGLEAVISGEPVSYVSLWCRGTRGQRPERVAQASVNTKFIAARNGLFMAEKSVTLILRELKRLVRGDCPSACGVAEFHPYVPASAFDFVRYLLRLGREAFVRGVEKAMIRARFRPGMFVLRTAEGDPRIFDPETAKEHRFDTNTYQADPFLWEVDGKRYCFFETYDYKTGKGHISVGRFDNGALVEVRTALKTNYHLSFPFVFMADEQLYMLPETCGARRIELWRCTRFPDEWEHHAVILDNVVAADSSIAKINGHWWLFTNISEDPFEEMNSELHVFRMDGPSPTVIEPHRLNPVVFDARTARNAGRIMEMDGQFYRPSQDNSHGTYGYAINLMRIVDLSMDSYAECLERKIEPTFARGLIGCHHLDMRSGHIVLDVRKRLGGLAWRGLRGPSSRQKSDAIGSVALGQASP